MAVRAARAERLAGLGRVAAGVAHEIRNPIAAARLQGENALAGDDARRREAIGDMLGQINRLDGLVSELLAMTQRVEPKPMQVDLGDLPREAGRASQGHCGREVARRRGARRSEGSATFDPAVVGRILDNLLTNAIRHAPDAGSRHSQRDPQPRPAVAHRRGYRPGRLAENCRAAVRAVRDRAAGWDGPGPRDRARAGRCPWRTLLLVSPKRGSRVRYSLWSYPRRHMATVLIVDDDRRSGARSRSPGDLGHDAAEAADGEAALAWLSRHAGRCRAARSAHAGHGRHGRAAPHPRQAQPAPCRHPDRCAEQRQHDRGDAAGCRGPPRQADRARRAEALLPRMLPTEATGSPGRAPPTFRRDGDLVGSQRRHARRAEVDRPAGGQRRDGAASSARPAPARRSSRGRSTGTAGARKGAVRAGQLRRDAGRAAREPAVRPRARRVHRRRSPTAPALVPRGATAARCSSTRSATCRSAMQAKLLRALQERVVTPVGGTSRSRSTCGSSRRRTATCCRRVRDGRFREDLYYRLGVVPLDVPPLRERLADIVPLAEHFLAARRPRPAAEAPRRANAAARLLAHAVARQRPRAAERHEARLDASPPASHRGRGSGVPVGGSTGALRRAGTPDWLAGTLPEASNAVEREMIRRASRQPAATARKRLSGWGSGASCSIRSSTDTVWRVPKWDEHCAQRGLETCRSLTGLRNQSTLKSGTSLALPPTGLEP